MELTINARKENKLLSRTDLNGVVSFTGSTPSNTDLIKELSKQVNAPENTVVVTHIYTNNGNSTARFSARIYASEEVKKRIEPPLKVKKDPEEKKK